MYSCATFAVNFSTFLILDDVLLDTMRTMASAIATHAVAINRILLFLPIANCFFQIFDCKDNYFILPYTKKLKINFMQL